MGRATPTFAELIRLFAIIGCFSFGGPAGQIALMQRELVDSRKWIPPERYAHALNFCMLLPGPEAQQLATYCGWMLHGVRGGLAAGLLFILPGAIIMLGLSVLYVTYGKSSFAQGLLFGIKAVVLVLVFDALLRLSKRALIQQSSWWIAAAAFAGLFFFHVPFPLIILLAGLWGYLRSTQAEVLAPMAEKYAAPHRPWLTTATGLLVWMAPMAALYALFGEAAVFTQLALFFSKMAVVTFGGAYAVLSYVAQEAVAHYNWLTTTEMIDGLGLAETTPGPLILVLQHVGFLAGWRNPAGLSPLAGGLLGAGVTSWVTFVPSILWIVLGAPYVEKLRNHTKLSGALSSITAAVVGVILTMALWFGLHVFFAEMTDINILGQKISLPVVASFSPAAALIALICGYLLLVRRQGLLDVLATGAVLGLAWHALGSSGAYTL